MIAIRADQENRIHEQQNVAAAKPLNQGVRGLPTKTAGQKAPKTPFKLPLNDENAAGKAGKDGLKTKGKGLATGKKNAFVTPGPLNRTALGNKTTNAKAHNFVTPGQKKAEVSPIKTQQQKTGSPRLRRSKVKVHSEEAEVAETDEDDVDIERMPPRSQPLLEYPSEDEFGPDKEFPHLRPENLMRGWAELSLDPVDDNGLRHIDRVRAEERAKIKRINEAKLQKSIDDTFEAIENDVREELGMPAKPKAMVKAPGTLRSKTAASALATAQSRQVGSSNASKANPAALNVRKSRQAAPPGASARFANATAASRSTLGYAQGRAISQKVRKPVTAIFRDPGAKNAAPDRMNPSVNQDLAPERSVQSISEFSLAEQRLRELLADDDESTSQIFAPVDLEHNEEDLFQLPLPEE